MRVLVDTHALLWHVEGSGEESDACRATLQDAQHEAVISITTCWEVAIKVSAGKLAITGTVDEYFARVFSLYPFHVLGIKLPHVALVSTLAFHHRDPFDRMLVAQALSEGMPIISRDTTLDAYGVTRIW